MPERHRTHRLEDQSRKRFESLIPNLWAIRAKHPDYGIDLEIEHFSEDGKATGLLFNVQLRATDDIKKRSKMPVKLDQLAYFEALDTPTIIVRYCSVDDSFHWCWHFNRVQSVSTAGQKTVTLTFDDSHRWTDDAPLQIDRTLRALRNAKKHSASDPILLIIEAGDLTPHENFHFESAVHDLIDAVPWLGEGDSNTRDRLVVTVAGSRGKVRISIDQLGSVTVMIGHVEREEVFTALLYGIALLLRQYGISAQAADIARIALKRGKAFHSREVAAWTCLALSSDPEAMIDLALLNNLASFEDETYGIIVVGLIASPECDDRINAAVRFFSTSADIARTAGVKEAEAASYYNIGNQYMNAGQLQLAIRSYNKARKTWPEYVEKQYFCLEVAGTLYLLRRYWLSSRLYERSVKLGEDCINDMRLGDALLFSGRPHDALKAFKSAIENAENFQMSAQAEVNKWLCEWLVTRFGVVVPTKRSEADALSLKIHLDEDGFLEKLEYIATELNCFNEVANFNLGVSLASTGKYDDAMARFLICALSVTHDTEAWANVIKCGWNLGSETVITCIAAALSLCGREAYAHFRADVVKDGMPDELIGHFDFVARELRIPPAPANRGLTVRLPTTLRIPD